MAKKIRKEARGKAQQGLVQNWLDAEKKYKAFKILLVLFLPLNVLLVILNIILLFK